MAGSYRHIVDDDGSFTMDLIENLGDAAEALQDCFRLIADYRAALAYVFAQIDEGHLGEHAMRPPIAPVDAWKLLHWWEK